MIHVTSTRTLTTHPHAVHPLAISVNSRLRSQGYTQDAHYSCTVLGPDRVRLLAQGDGDKAARLGIMAAVLAGFTVTPTHTGLGVACLEITP